MTISVTVHTFGPALFFLAGDIFRLSALQCSNRNDTVSQPSECALEGVSCSGSHKVRFPLKRWRMPVEITKFKWTL